MEPEFWLERWQANLIGFHQAGINDYLLRYWLQLGVPHTGRVLVPLCGKSLDMLWLAEQGHPVTGVEISQLAIEAFFTENGLKPEIHREHYGLRYVHGQIELLCADFFVLTPQDTGVLSAFYDRAALIALTPVQRPAYARHLDTLLDKGTRGLLVTLRYNPLEMGGPPFSVTDDEIQRLFSRNYSPVQLCAHDVLAENEKFRDKGLTSLSEQVYRLIKR